LFDLHLDTFSYMNNKNAKTLQVSAIKDGTAIDHIPADKLFTVISILGLDRFETQITFGTNLESKILGKKAIIKIADVYFPDNVINKIALVAPDAKLNIIHNYIVCEKRKVTIPDEIKAIAKCMNPQCITNHESIATKFQVLSKENLELRCHYCEKITDKEHIEFI
jgi:aspartate carbamoyltransferase regulatory subunit